MKPLFSLLVVLPLILASCNTYSDEQLNEFDEKIQSYLTKNDLQCERSNSGLYYNIIEPGEGDFIQYRDVVKFTYTGKFTNGDIFDKQKDGVEFEVSQLIGAWKEIMLELKPGGKAFLVAPPQLGYGDRDLDDIPPNSILVFELEVLEVK